VPLALAAGRSQRVNTPRSRAAVDTAPFDLEDHVTGIWYVVGFVIAGTLFVFATIGLAWLISHRTRGDEHKGYPYESGIDTYGDTHARFGISFYIYALMFVAFDIEVIFIFLWALIFQSTPPGELVGLFVTMLIFVGILLFGLAYAWRKGVLTWR
jgi:NADH-quinone oxidoreductase subunit A